MHNHWQAPSQAPATLGAVPQASLHPSVSWMHAIAAEVLLLQPQHSCESGSGLCTLVVSRVSGEVMCDRGPEHGGWAAR